jgi:ubiquinone/menaquinone biosynthesis C-methylase UbiE
MTAATIKGYRGMGMEGAVARWYDRSTRKDMERFRALAARLRTVLPQGGDMLEVAPGPGYLAIEMAKGGAYRVTGLDVSRTMVELGQGNAAEAGVEVDFRQGNASAMPYADESFDLLACSAAFKNFSQPHRALEEMYRVLRPGGTALVLDLRKDVPMSEIRKYFGAIGLSTINRWMTLAAFRFMLLKRAYTRGQLERMLADIPFRSKQIRLVDIGIELWLQK